MTRLMFALGKSTHTVLDPYGQIRPGEDCMCSDKFEKQTPFFELAAFAKLMAALVDL